MYRVRTVLPDNLAQDPGLDSTRKNLPDAVEDCLENDYGQTFPVGTQVIIERIA